MSTFPTDRMKARLWPRERLNPNLVFIGSHMEEVQAAFFAGRTRQAAIGALQVLAHALYPSRSEPGPTSPLGARDLIHGVWRALDEQQTVELGQRRRMHFEKAEAVPKQWRRQWAGKETDATVITALRHLAAALMRSVSADVSNENGRQKEA